MPKWSSTTMPKWKEPPLPTAEDNGRIRVVNYVAGFTGPEEGMAPVIHHRLEQLWDGQWAEVPVYFDGVYGLVRTDK